MLIYRSRNRRSRSVAFRHRHVQKLLSELPDNSGNARVILRIPKHLETWIPLPACLFWSLSLRIRIGRVREGQRVDRRIQLSDRVYIVIFIAATSRILLMLLSVPRMDWRLPKQGIGQVITACSYEPYAFSFFFCFSFSSLLLFRIFSSSKHG